MAALRGMAGAGGAHAMAGRHLRFRRAVIGSGPSVNHMVDNLAA